MNSEFWIVVASTLVLLVKRIYYFLALATIRFWTSHQFCMEAILNGIHVYYLQVVKSEIAITIVSHVTRKKRLYLCSKSSLYKGNNNSWTKWGLRSRKRIARMSTGKFSLREARSKLLSFREKLPAWYACSHLAVWDLMQLKCFSLHVSLKLVEWPECVHFCGRSSMGAWIQGKWLVALKIAEMRSLGTKQGEGAWGNVHFLALAEGLLQMSPYKLAHLILWWWRGQSMSTLLRWGLRSCSPQLYLVRILF